MSVRVVLLACLIGLVVSTVSIAPEWRPTGQNADGNTEIRVVFALHQENLEELERLFWERSDPRNPLYSQYLSRKQLANLLAPGAEAQTGVITWLTQNGFESSQISTVETNDVVVARGAVHLFERLLKVKFEYFRHAEVESRTILRSSTKYSLPKSVASHIQLVHGVNDFPPLYRRNRKRSLSEPHHEIFPEIQTADSTVSITSVNARSQTPGSAIIVNVAYTCSSSCPSTISVNVTSANPNILFATSAQIPVSSCSNSKCSATIQVENYVPLNVSAMGFDSNSTPMTAINFWTYPVVVNPHVVPQTLWDLYSMTRNPLVTNRNATQCVVEFEQQYYSPSDLNEFFGLMGIPPAPVTVIGPNDASNPGAEANLDIQWIMAMAPGAPTVFWSIYANSTVEIDHILTWCYEIGNYSDPPLVNSLSYGMTEGNVDKYLGAGYLNRTNTELQKLALQGLTIIIADGDTGANDIGPPPMSQLQCFPSHPDWPSDSAYVTAIGSTYITPLSEIICYVPEGTNCLNNPLGEVAVSVDMGMTWTTGGGFSNITPRPSYQNDAVERYLHQPVVPPGDYYNSTGRAYADAVTVGHNLEVVLSGSLVAIDGTSASAPIFAGIVTVLNDLRLNLGKAPLGFINPLLYSTFEETPAAWSDITVGHNKCGAYGWKPVCCEAGFQCAVGWDPVTGAGSPNVELLKQIVMSLP